MDAKYEMMDEIDLRDVQHLFLFRVRKMGLL